LLVLNPEKMVKVFRYILSNKTQVIVNYSIFGSWHLYKNLHVNSSSAIQKNSKVLYDHGCTLQIEDDIHMSL
jgi:hypothetical protein